MITIREARRGEMQMLLDRTIETSWNDLPASARARTSREAVARQVAGLVAQLRDSGPNTFLVAEDEAGQNVGHLWLGEMRDAYSGESRGYILDLFVVPAARGQGIATALLAEAERLARQRGYAEIGLTVAAQNAQAHRLYQKLGFETERLLMSKPLAE